MKTAGSNLPDPTLQKSPRSSGRLLAMMLIGAGLIVMGVVSALLLGRPQSFGGSRSIPDEYSARPMTVNYPAPELKLTDLQGNPVSLADFQGQVVLVNNWATWCPPCKDEMPTLQAFYEKHRSKGFTLVAIEAGEPVEDVQAFVEDYGLTFPVWPDPQQKALRTFRNDTLPSSYVIDRSGTVVLVWSGAISRNVLDQYMIPLLEN